MTSRARYLLGRAAEAPMRVLFQKLWMRLKPWMFYPAYRAQAFSRSTAGQSVVEFKNIGADLRANARLTMGESIAGHLSDGTFPCLGYGTVQIPRGIEWHSDVFHGHTWSKNYFPNCDYLASAQRCDVKVPWEFGRLQYALWMAIEYVNEPVEQSAHLSGFDELVTDFSDQNPAGFGVQWSCPMEVAIRATNLAFSAALLADNLSESTLNRIIRDLKEHLKFVNRFPETSDVNGNHYLADLMGVYVLCRLLYGADSGRTANAIADFSTEATRQFEDDGGHFERAPVYHRFCAEMVAIVAALSWRDENTESENLLAILDRSMQFCDSIGSSKSLLPVIGDNDSGHVFWFGEDARDYSQIAEFLHALAAGRQATDCSSAKGAWLVALAGNGARIRPKSKEELADAYIAGIRSGFAFAKSGRNEVTMRIGEQGLLGRAPHDHDDALSVWLFRDGRDLLVEAGCHSYTLDRTIRTHYISAAAHNVVGPEKGSRFKPIVGSVFDVVRGAPTARLSRFDSDKGETSLEASLDTSPSSNFESCNRAVTLSDSQFVVSDSWMWSKQSAAVIRWQLAPHLSLSMAGNAGEIQIVDEANAFVGLIKVECAQSVDISVVNVDYSPLYGSSTECDCLFITVAKHRSAELRTTFSFEKIS